MGVNPFGLNAFYEQQYRYSDVPNSVGSLNSMGGGRNRQNLIVVSGATFPGLKRGSSAKKGKKNKKN